MFTKRILLAAALLTAVVATASVASAGPGDRGAGAGRRGRAARGPRPPPPAMKLLRHLGQSDEQKALVKQAREAAAPGREDVREQMRAVLAAARKGERTPQAREQAKAQVKAILDSARTSLEREARRLLDSLTPEQRQKIADFAAKHGKTVDEARLLKRVEGLLLMPGRGAHRPAPAAK